MGDFTSLGAKIWRWRRWRVLDAHTRLFWLGLYTSLHAKQYPPGLWKGGISVMVEETGYTGEQVVRSLDRLLAADLVEYDEENAVLRMTELPDAGEWPSQANWLKGWWNRFKMVPECAVRDAHIPTLRWILDEGARERGNVVSHNVEQAWLDTFARVTIPPMQRRGVLRLEGNSDTSTAVQPSLFSGLLSPPTPELLPGASRVPEATSSEGSETLDYDSGNVSHATAGRPSNNPRTTLDRGSGIGIGTGSLSSGGIGGLSTGPGDAPVARPTLVLVPPPGAFTVDGLAALWKGSPYWPPVLADGQRFDLGHAIAALPAAAAAVDVLALLGQYIASGSGGQVWAEISRGGPGWFSIPGRLPTLVSTVIAWRREAEDRSAAFREARDKLNL